MAAPRGPAGAINGSLTVLGVLELELNDGARVDELASRAQKLVASGADGAELRWAGLRWANLPGPGGLPALVTTVASSLAVPIAVRCGSAGLARRLIDAGASILIAQGRRETAAVAPIVAGSRIGLIATAPSPNRVSTDGNGAVDGLIRTLADLASAATGKGVPRVALWLDPTVVLTSPSLMVDGLPRLVALEYAVALEPGALVATWERDLDPMAERGWEAEGAIATIAVAAGVSLLRVHDPLRLGRVGRMADAIARSVADVAPASSD